MKTLEHKQPALFKSYMIFVKFVFMNVQKIKFFIEDFFSKCDHICSFRKASFLWIVYPLGDKFTFSRQPSNFESKRFTDILENKDSQFDKLSFLLSPFFFCANEKKEYLPNIINVVNGTVETP